jgi:hypothetical protein
MGYDHHDQAAFDRFVAGMTVTQEMAHDGVGYDLDPLYKLADKQLATLVWRLAPCADWRDVEALHEIAKIDEDDSGPRARAALRARVERAGDDPDDVALRCKKALMELGEPCAELEVGVVEALDRLGTDPAYDLALDEAEHYPQSAAVKRALLRGAKLHPERGAHCAALLFYFAGIAQEPFDWDHRPFFLRFNPGQEADRAKAFEELCAKTRLRLE